MVTIWFSIANFHAMLALPKGRKFNATYYADVVLWRVFDSGLKADGRQLITRADNAEKHTAQTVQNFFEENQPQRSPLHPTHRIWHPAISIFSDILNYG
jgi:hypothetical protein